MTNMFELAVPMTSTSELVLGIFENVSLVSEKIESYLRAHQGEEVRFVIRNINPEEYMQ